MAVVSGGFACFYLGGTYIEEHEGEKRTHNPAFFGALPAPVPRGEAVKSLVQFGAGNIGRSFIGQLFSQSGYEVILSMYKNHLLASSMRKKSIKSS